MPDKEESAQLGYCEAWNGDLDADFTLREWELLFGDL
jgi:hypothetical protein